MATSRGTLGSHNGVTPRRTGSGSSGRGLAPTPQAKRPTEVGGARVGHGPRTPQGVGRASKGVNSGKR